MSATLATIKAVQAAEDAKKAAEQAAAARKAVIMAGAQARIQSLIDDFNSAPLRLKTIDRNLRLTHSWTNVNTIRWPDSATVVRSLKAGGVRPLLVWREDSALVMAINAAFMYGEQGDVYKLLSVEELTKVVPSSHALPHAQVAGRVTKDGRYSLYTYDTPDRDTDDPAEFMQKVVEMAAPLLEEYYAST